MPERPAYKKHPLWESAMALTRDAYALAERVKDASPDTASRLRKAAVAVPAHVAGALSGGAGQAPGARSGGARRDRRGRAPGGEVARRALAGAGAAAETLDLSVLFEFGAGESAR